ncbi:MAG: cadherin-like beta sandwich domain-containing protein, partial [Spirochaetales bacterium]|nr:cadherin-like beta sandwich domain-containing protein [Spirochaetales bacterium]
GKKCQNGENVSVTLEIGENIIEVCVENAGLTKTYKIKIVRQSENPSDNATLRSLELKHGNDLIALTPVFSPNVVNYTANVDYDVSSVALSYETADSAAVANIDIENLKDIPLNIGKNAINIIVTAEDGKTTKTYSVNVIRADKPVNDCKLASVSVNGKNLAVKSEMEVTVDTSSVAISVTSENSAHTVTIAGEEASDVVLDLTGENLLEIKVDSGNGAFITYKLKIKVLQISAATLAGIKVDDKTLTVQKNMGHVVAAKNAVVTVEVNNETQSVKINNEDITSSKNYSVKVAADDATFGNKSVKITLTDKEGKTVDYYLTLTYQETVTGKIIVHAYNYTHIWAWNKADEKDNYTGGKWPGVEMTQEENSNWYTFTIEKTTSMVIFSNKGAGQTANLERTEGEWWYKDGKWSAYPADNVPPVVSFVIPTSNANLSGVVTCEVNASDDREMGYVDFFVDGKKKKTVKVLPYAFDWDTTVLKNGTHTLKAVAYDASGNSASTEEIEVTTTNANIPPVAVIGGSKRVPVSTTKNYRGTGSYDLNGEIVSYKWSITGGVKLDSDSASSVNITVPANISTYTLTLTVTDDLGATDTTSIDVETYPGTETSWDFRDETIYFAITTRFYDGDKSNNVHCWDENASTPADDPSWRGDFKGLIEKLDYIKALGFSAVWITPVVENCSGLDYHGYHAMNFSKVDPRYESDDVDFQTLIDEVHARDMKLVLDVVFQHTGNFGEDTLAPMFVKDYVNGDHEDINSILQPHPETLLDWNAYIASEGSAQYQMRLALMKNTDGVNHDYRNYYHHYGHGNWDTFSSQWMQIAGDCVDLNTENPAVLNYIVKAYSQYIKMGV